MMGLFCSECDGRGVVWGRGYEKFNTEECEDCLFANNWKNILILVIELLLIMLY